MAAAENQQPGEGEKTEEPGGQVVLFGKFEGQRVTDARLNFGGNIALGDPKVIEALKLNGEAVLIVKGYVASRGHKMKSTKDGGRAGAVSSSTFIVESVALDESSAA